MLNRNAQMGVKVESVEGVEEALAAADFRGVRTEMGMRYGVVDFDRGVIRPTLSPLPKVKSQVALMLNYMSEMGGGAAATPAPWHTDLQAMGFVATALRRVPVNIGGATNIEDFEPGAIITDGGSKSARFVDFSATHLIYEPLAGGDFADTDVVEEQKHSSGSITVTAGAAADSGYAFHPLTETVSGGSPVLSPSVTGQYRLGGQIHGGAGGRANGRILLRQGETLRLAVELQLLPIMAGVGYTPRTGDPLVVTGNPSGAPVKVSGIEYYLQAEGTQDRYVPILTECEIALNNVLTPRKTFTNAAVGHSGATAVRITDRKPSTRIDPLHILPNASPYQPDFIGRLLEGLNAELVAKVGSLTGTHGKVIVWAPRTQPVGDFEPGDRDGETTAPLDVEFCGTDDGIDDELTIYHAFG